MPSLSVPFSLNILVSTNQKLCGPVLVGFYWVIIAEAGLITSLAIGDWIQSLHTQKSGFWGPKVSTL